MSIFDKFITDTVEATASWQGLFEDEEPVDISEELGFTKVYKAESQTRYVPLSYSTPFDLYVLGLTIWTQTVVDYYRNLGL